MCVKCFIAKFTLLRWSGTKTSISLKYIVLFSTVIILNVMIEQIFLIDTSFYRDNLHNLVICGYRQKHQQLFFLYQRKVHCSEFSSLFKPIPCSFDSIFLTFAMFLFSEHRKQTLHPKVLKPFIFLSFPFLHFLYHFYTNSLLFLLIWQDVIYLNVHLPNFRILTM